MCTSQMHGHGVSINFINARLFLGIIFVSNQIALPITGGGEMPSVGLGLWKIANAQAADIVHQALQTGYRHVDAACDYGNEREAGDGIQRAFQDKLCTRDQVWITSKLWNTYHHPKHVRPALERTLRDLQVDHLDLYLIHFPISLTYVPVDQRYPPGWFNDPSALQPAMTPDCVPIADTWGAMEELHRAGLVRHIGISNFGTSLIRDLLSYATIRPSVLQVESHPYLTQEKLLRYCQQERIAYTAFSPLGAGSYIPLGMATADESVLGQEVIYQLADAHGKTPAQIVLRWGVQRGTAVIPKTSQPQRLKENLDIFDFELSPEQMLSISQLNRHQRFNDPGAFCEPAFGCFYPIYE